MKPVKLRAVNVCQHEDTTLDYECGITGITGQNGCGKSNLVDTIQYFGITGRTPSEVNKSDLLMWGKVSGFTEFVFIHDGVEHSLKRNVHNTAIVLTIGDGDDAKKVKNSEANEYMQAVIGTPFDVFYEACWCPQGGLLGILTMQHSHRMAFFQKLAGTRQAETLRGMLQAGLARIPALLDRSDDIASLEEGMVLAEAELATTRANHGKLVTLKASFDDRQADVGRIISTPTEQQRDAKVSSLTSQLKMATDKKEAFLSESKLEKQDPVEPPDFNKLSQWQAYISDTQRLDEASDAVIALQEEIECLAVLSRDGILPQEEIDSLGEVLHDTKQKIKMVEEGVCPTCKREYADLPDLALLKVLEAETSSKIMDSRQKLLAYTNLESEHKSKQSALDIAKGNRSAILNKVQAWASEVVNFDKTAYDVQDSKYRTYTTYMTDKAKHEERIRQLDQDIAQAEARVAEAREMVVVTEADVKNAQDFQQNYRALSSKLLDTTKDLGLQESTFTHMGSTLSRFQSEQKAREKSQAIRRKLERSREVLHRDHLPKVVMSQMLDGLNMLLDEYLSKFDTNYTAYVNDDFDFVVNFPHKEDVPVRRLSGGQKVALAIAFRFAVSDLFAGALPLLTLDEPTVFLDEANVIKVGDVLKKARENAEAGTNVIISTHDTLLIPSFSRTFVVDEK